MTVLADIDIAMRCASNFPMIKPFEPRTVVNGKTMGLGPCGYDVTVEFDGKGEKQVLVIAPHCFVLASTIERFIMPSNIVGKVHDKSSWARHGLTVQNTVIEPGWCGWLTLELTNHSDGSITIRRGDPIAQVLFETLSSTPHQPYNGKYQSQARGPVEWLDEKPYGL